MRSEERRLLFFFSSYGFWGQTRRSVVSKQFSSSWEFYGLKEREMQTIFLFFNIRLVVDRAFRDCHASQHQVMLLTTFQIVASKIIAPGLGYPHAMQLRAQHMIVFRTIERMLYQYAQDRLLCTP